jgi:hypothetical protein
MQPLAVTHDASGVCYMDVCKGYVCRAYMLYYVV